MWKVITLAFILCFTLSNLAHAGSEEKGKVIVNNLIKSNKATILIFGGATNDPRLSLIYKHHKDWNNLSKDAKVAVAEYIKSLVVMAKQNPANYINMSKSAPFYRKAVTNAQNMCLDCWEITHETDDTYLMGDEAWERHEYKGKTDISFSNFAGNKVEVIVDTRGNKKVSQADVFSQRIEMLNTKLSKEPILAQYYTGITGERGRIYIRVNSQWIHSPKTERESFLKVAFQVWGSTGQSTGIGNDADDYFFFITSNINTNKLASWNVIDGYQEHF